MGKWGVKIIQVYGKITRKYVETKRKYLAQEEKLRLPYF